ncbi:hypothetical protein CDL12_12561 [Handroanthus impetiginosus]|uniref:HTH myb-type domain-containing protein n=1 Tax=Handroanthus impetiginosus TaxID=429701 RepID=A0A2G9HBC2_9LAMI|nr:hypothetical protein CDL12_12561 [Handroanthus impetiginosus]
MGKISSQRTGTVKSGVVTTSARKWMNNICRELRQADYQLMIRDFCAMSMLLIWEGMIKINFDGVTSPWLRGMGGQCCLWEAVMDIGKLQQAEVEAKAALCAIRKAEDKGWESIIFEGEWTLIAGRLPGRTANDVKNFWNSHTDKKLPTTIGETTKENAQKTTTECNIIRPRTWTFSNCQVPWRRETIETTKPYTVWTSDENPKNNQLDLSSQTDECVRWWSNLLEMAKENMANEKHQTVHCPQEILAGSFDDNEDNVATKGQGDVDGFCDFCVDIDVWELLSFGDG